METSVDLKSATAYLEEKPAPHVIILDLRLPTGETEKTEETPEKENGMTILKRVKTNEKFQNTPVIVFTNLSDKETEYECKKLGADGFMVKSKVLPSELLNTVVNLVK
jgi:CheY-like chemotaxis protein